MTLSAPMARLLLCLLYGLPPYDPPAYTSVLAILLVAGIVASAIPARRAARIDPAEALRVKARERY